MKAEGTSLSAIAVILAVSIRVGGLPTPPNHPSSLHQLESVSRRSSNQVLYTLTSFPSCRILDNVLVSTMMLPRSLFSTRAQRQQE